MPILQRSLRTIKPVYMISCFLGQVPSYNFKKNQGIVALYLWYVSTFDFKSLGMTTAVIDALNTITFTLSQLFVIIRTAILQRDDWVDLLQRIHEIEQILRIKNKSSLNVYLELLAGHLYCLVIIYNVRSNSAQLPPQQILLLNGLIYYIFVSAMMSYNFALCLNQHYVELNRRLQNGVNIDLRRLHFRMVEASLKFNENFGWNFFFLTVNIVFTILQAFDYTIVSSRHGVTATQLNIIVVQFLLAIMLLVFGIVVIYACDQVLGNANETSLISYKLLNEPEHCNSREEMVLLAQQTRLFQKFTAARFFDVDVSLLLSVFGVIASNLIIIIQLNP